jgi:hypothetical protein
MNDTHNIISLGDNCAIPLILSDLCLRKKSYPFDWIAHKSLIYETNLIHNFNLVKELMTTGDVSTIVKNLVGDIFSPESKTRINKNGIWFPHDHGTNDEIIEKYERRFTRMMTDIREKPAIFMMLIRHVVISQSVFDEMVRTLLSYNKDNKIIFVSGSDHHYMKHPKYKNAVLFKYIKFEVEKMDAEFSHESVFFRPEIKKFLYGVFSKLGYHPKYIPLENEITKIPNKLRMQFLR